MGSVEKGSLALRASRDCTIDSFDDRCLTRVSGSQAYRGVSKMVFHKAPNKYVHWSNKKSDSARPGSFIQAEPKKSRKKSIDIWIFFILAIMVVFVVILAIVCFVCSKRYFPKPAKKKKKEKKSKGTKPGRLADTDWKQFFDAEGRPYYYNEITGRTQWEHPLENGSASEAGGSSGTDAQ